MTKQNQFDTEHLHDDIKGHTIRGGIATLGAQGFSFVLSIGSVAILARLLTPSDFGLVAMVTALTGLLAMFKDAGLSMATVQRDTVTHEQVSTLFWVNIALSLFLVLTVAALAPLVAEFYHEPRLQPITLAIACMFIFDGLAVQHQALLRRQMRFGVLAKIQIISTLLALAAAIGSALTGMGYWALILQIAVNQFVSAILSWVYCRWVPGLPKRGVGTRSMLKFGGYLTGFNFVNYFARNADNTLIGYAWGSNSLGLYAKAYSLLLMPLQQINGPITAIATPALCRLQNDPEQFRAFFVKILSVIAFVTFPLIAWMIVCRREIILLFLGSQWEGAVPIFSILAVSAFFQPIGNITGVLYTALGRTKRMFKWGLMGCSWIVFSFFVGLPFGVIGVAWAYSAAIALMMYPLMRYAIAGTCIELKDFFDGIKHSLLATLAITGIGVPVQYFSLDKPLWLTLALTSSAMVLTYVLISYKLNPELLRQARNIVLKKDLNLS
ncbi:MAG: lipopolysaccharide biosynthesis protein [Proteobacteria bacterium]|nr:lipopolysaccharide biosynthesis protein [Pseudomonadota bacterium]